MNNEIENLYELFLKHPLISKDTRTIEPNSLFFALKDKRDGNEFAKEAIDKGAAYAIIDDVSKYKSQKYILVDNVLQTLQKLANFHRSHLKAKIICVAGSNGKTTTKELLNRVLSTKFKTFATIGNFNNHIGVPEMLLKLNKFHDFAIIELGANHLGEHKTLCEIANPNFGIVTNCGKDHLEGYGSIEGVIQSNKEVYDYLELSGGIAFVNQSDKLLVDISVKCNQIFYGVDNEELLDEFPVKLKIQDTIIHSSVFGSFHKHNISCAYAIGKYFDISENLIKEAIENYIPTNNRSELISWNGNKVLLDAYNANPSSMSAIIDNFSNYSIKGKIAILGDMLELGEHSYSEHQLIIDQLKASKIDKVILIGNEFKKHSTPYIHFDTNKELKKWLQSQALKDCFFLVKGSRSLSLERAFV